MENTQPRFWLKIKAFFTSKWVIGALVIIVLIVLYSVFHKKKSPYQFVTVQTGTISEVVSVTGNTTPVHSVALGFGNSGMVGRVYVAVGDKVYTGQTLASLNVSDLSAQLKQAQANVDAQQAKLDGIKAGSRPEDIRASQASVDKASQDLANMYGTIVNTSNDSYAKANDAVRTQTSSLFSNADTNNIQLTFATNNAQAATDAKAQRLAAGTTLATWQTELVGLSADSSPTTLDAAVKDGLAYLASIRQLLNSISGVLNSATNLDASTLASDKTSLGVAVNEVNAASTNLSTISQNIASQKLTISQLQAQLNLKLVGSTQSDIDAQQAQVEAAQANMQSIQAKLSNSVISAPIDGVVTQEDAKVGQIVSPGSPLISIISSQSLEVDSAVPETDIGKIALGDSVSMTFDAFGGETFVGQVFYIDPAQTINQGVVDYKIKVNFKTPDPRMKSGLTANLDIKTTEKDNTLILPQYAVIQNDKGAFVEKLDAGIATQTPVTLGIQDQDGNVEILSGVTAGEQVVNIGLKK